MIVNKITTGFVVQQFDTDTRSFVSQEFVASDQVEFENQDGEGAASFDEYLPFDMKQPVNEASSQSSRLAAVERFVKAPSEEEWANLRATILRDHPLRVILIIQGGNYQDAAATGPVVIEVLDYDNWKACDEAHQDEAKYYAELEAEVERLNSDPPTTLL
jgi:hypothetical protein